MSYIKKKIVYVVESLGGGVLTYLEQLSNHLSNEFDITILYGKRKQTPDHLENLFNANINLVPIKHFQRSLNPVADFKAYKEVKKCIDDIHPDIVHLNSSKAGAIGRIIKFINFHNYRDIDFYYTPHGYSFLMSNSSNLKRFVYYSIEKILGILNTKTIACGKGEYELAKKISKNSTYVNNCVDVNEFKLFMNKDSNSKKVIYTLGRINFQKNPKMFNRIALNNPGYRFVWIGDGPDRNLLNADNIEVTGWLTKKEMLKKVQPYKFFMLCSRWEGLPISLLESMCMGKICLVTNVLGMREVIQNGVNGFIINDDFKMEEICTNSLVGNVSKKAQNDAENKYSIDNFINEYKKIYDKDNQQ